MSLQLYKSQLEEGGVKCTIRIFTSTIFGEALQILVYGQGKFG